MEYVVGPILALLIGMKFTAWNSKQVDKKLAEMSEVVDMKIKEQNEVISTQTLKILMPVAKSVNAINNQLGL